VVTLGSPMGGGTVVSIVRSGGRITQIGCRGPVEDDGYATHFGYDVEPSGSMKLRPGRRRFFVGKD
jgi:hypothetical protein